MHTVTPFHSTHSTTMVYRLTVADVEESEYSQGILDHLFLLSVLRSRVCLEFRVHHDDPGLP